MQRFWTLTASAAAILLVSTSGALAKTTAHHGKAQSSATKASAQSSASAARLGSKPNLNGIWEAMNSANWDLEPHDATEAPVAPDQLGAIGAIPAGRGVVEGGTIPYLPAALEQRTANRKSAPKGDPEAACYLPGIPRATYMNHPFQIIQGDNGDILMAYEYDAANRTVYMQKAVQPPIDTWMGTSYGQWEGDTLVVTTLSQNGMTWMDRAGDYLSPSAKVTERFTLKDPNHIWYEATIEDPSVFSKPWKISMPLYRRVEPNAELLDFRCVPFADLLVYGDLLQKKDAAPASAAK
jgi:hypothetical protein